MARLIFSSNIKTSSVHMFEYIFKELWCSFHSAEYVSPDLSTFAVEHYYLV